MAHPKRVNLEWKLDFLLAGLVVHGAMHMAPFEMAQAHSIQFSRTNPFVPIGGAHTMPVAKDELFPEVTRTLEQEGFTQFVYPLSEEEGVLHLLANKDQGLVLLPKYKVYNFLLILRSSSPGVRLFDQWVQRFKSLPSVQVAQVINTEPANEFFHLLA